MLKTYGNTLLRKQLYSSIPQYPLFDKILIANRGEIACRVMRSAKKLGIKTVAVYSEADKDSMHVKMADESYCVGPAASSESYLRWEKILEVAKNSKASAIHPGYGFLSENADFAEVVAQAGIEFIGPPAQAIVAMGSKSESKNIMIKAGVPVVPGYHGENQDPSFLAERASEMGFPVLIKAIKGGGGKGMRIVDSSEEFLEKLESSKRESIKHFSDDKVLIEKYIKRSRHVEVQVFGDKFGDAVYLFERDCSVQRRHQKVLEEAPAPNISDELRTSLGNKAVAAAKAVKYVGAGTVEFILDCDTNEFYFMEMNTRLQVEHPITEMVTNTDLVEWQIKVASGNPIPLKQNEIKLNGHAFEARIYAENPDNQFMPDTGKLIHYSVPEGTSTVRVETGVREGDEVSVHYDPMISKLVTWGESRSDALRTMTKALGEFEVVGPQTNVEFLKKLSSHKSFANGDVDTSFIDNHRKDLLNTPTDLSPATLAIAALHQYIDTCQADSLWAENALFRINHQAKKKITFYTDKNRQSKAEIFISRKGNFFNVEVITGGTNSSSFTDCIAESSDGVKKVFHLNNSRYASSCIQKDDILSVFVKGLQHNLYLPLSAKKSNIASGDAGLLSPMPCKISHVNVVAGAKVKKGQTLVVVEAMKMEHVIKSPFEGVIKRICYQVGDIVPQGKKLVEFENPEKK